MAPKEAEFLLLDFVKTKLPPCYLGHMETVNRLLAGAEYIRSCAENGEQVDLDLVIPYYLQHLLKEAAA